MSDHFRQKVVRAVLEPPHFGRWRLELVCGHQFRMRAKRRPGRPAGSKSAADYELPLSSRSCSTCRVFTRRGKPCPKCGGKGIVRTGTARKNVVMYLLESGCPRCQGSGRIPL